MSFLQQATYRYEIFIEVPLHQADARGGGSLVQQVAGRQPSATSHEILADSHSDPANAQLRRLGYPGPGRPGALRCRNASTGSAMRSMTIGTAARVTSAIRSGDIG